MNQNQLIFERPYDQLPAGFKAAVSPPPAAILNGFIPITLLLNPKFEIVIQIDQNIVPGQGLTQGDLNDAEDWIDEASFASWQVAQPANPDPLVSTSWPTGAIAIFGIGNVAKTRVANQIADSRHAIHILHGEPDAVGSITDDALRFRVAVALRANYVPIVIDSLRLPYRLAEGGGSKKGGLAPGFDRLMTALSTIGLFFERQIIAVVNPGDPAISSTSDEAAMMAAVVAESTMGIVHLLSASPAKGVSAIWGFRPDDRYSNSTGSRTSYYDQTGPSNSQLINFNLQDIV